MARDVRPMLDALARPKGGTVLLGPHRKRWGRTDDTTPCGPAVGTVLRGRVDPSPSRAAVASAPGDPLTSVGAPADAVRPPVIDDRAAVVARRVEAVSG